MPNILLMLCDTEFSVVVTKVIYVSLSFGRQSELWKPTEKLVTQVIFNVNVIQVVAKRSPIVNRVLSTLF